MRLCGAEMDVFGDHVPCCHNGPSLLFRHNNGRDILGHAVRGAGLTAVVIEKKNQIDGSNAKPGDITVQQYHRGFASSSHACSKRRSITACVKCLWRQHEICEYRLRRIMYAG